MNTTEDSSSIEVSSGITKDTGVIDAATGIGSNINVGYTTFITIVCFLTVFGNAGTMIAFFYEKSLQEKPSDLLVLSLSVADFFIGLVALPLLSPLYIIGYWPLGERLCKLNILFASLVVNSSLFTLLAISIDRVLLVSLDYSKYVKLQTRRQVKFTIIFCWTLSFISVALEWGLWNYSKTVNVIAANINFGIFCLSPSRRIQTFSTLYFVISILSPITFVGISSVVFLFLLLKRLHKRRRQVGPASGSVSHSTMSTIPSATASTTMASSSTAAGGSNSSESSTRQRYMKPAITLFGLVSAMVICMFPYCCYVIVVEGFCPKCGNVKVLYGVLILQLCNGCLDPFFYAITQSKIRQFYRRKITNLCRFSTFVNFGNAVETR